MMPRYFFNIQDGVETADGDGTELADLETAKREAVRLAGQMICEHADAFWDTQEWRMTVADRSGLALFNLVFVATEPGVVSSKFSA